MTQTLNAHMNKRKKNKFNEIPKKKEKRHQKEATLKSPWQI
jgi:hypothetical protein